MEVLAWPLTVLLVASTALLLAARYADRRMMSVERAEVISAGLRGAVAHIEKLSDRLTVIENRVGRK